MKKQLLQESELLSLIYEGNRNALLSDKPNYCKLCVAEEPHFHASQIGYCTRRQQYDILHKIYPKVMSGYNATWLKDGMFHEEIVKSGLLGSNVKILEYQYKPHIKYKDTIIVTHYDLLIEVNGIKYFIEIKSVKDWSWKDIIKTGIIPFRYVQQLMLYQNEHKIENGFVLLKRRMTSEMLPYYFKLNKKVVKDIFVKQQAILEATDKQKIVPRPYPDNKNFECRKMCPYYLMCWETD